MIPQEHISLFEDYISNVIGDKERLEFEARLSYDSEFKSFYDEYLAVARGVKEHFQKEYLRQRLKEADDSLDAKVKTGKTYRKRIITACISLAAGFTLAFGIYYNNANHVKMVSELWPYEEGLPVRMGQSTPYHSGMNAFKLEKWDEAITLLNKLDSDTAKYFTALSLYQLEHYEDAAQLLSKVSKPSIFYEDAEIRLALLDFLDDNKMDAKKILNKIRRDKNHKHHDLALRILKKI